MPSLGPWRFTVDRRATEAAYRQSGEGGADTCACAWCRNFRLARSLAFPPAFLSLLHDLGVDPAKDAEVFECGWDSDAAGHYYGGWHHFVGRLEGGSDEGHIEIAPNFSVGFGMAAGEPKLLTDVIDLELVRLDFVVKNVPWLLDEDDPR